MNTTLCGSLLLLSCALTATVRAPAQSPDANTATRPLIGPAAPRPKPARYKIPTGWEPHVLTVKFRDGLLVRLRDGALTDLGTGALAKAGPVLERLRAGTWSRTHVLAEADLDRLRAIGERNVGLPLHDLNLQFRCELPAAVDAAAMIDLLNALDCVEIAESIPGMAPLPQAPDVRHKQGYCEPGPRGTGVGPFQGQPDNALLTNLAATGGHARIADIEYGFDPVHVDLQPVAVLTPGGYSTPTFDAHGTAVLGQLFARNDGLGTTGIAPAAQVMFAHARTMPTVGQPNGFYCVDSSIQLAAAAVGYGGVVLIEQQIGGPLWNGLLTSQFGLMPVEWHGPTWQAIRNAVAGGVIVVEAAGNGSQNLDDPLYGGWFAVPNDSGALMVGAGAAPGGSDVARSRLYYSNFGETGDLQGWGEQVTTTGYGDLYNAGGPNATYTAVFSGTSSASPIVAGACALLQSLHFERRATYLGPADLRAALRRSGAPQQDGGYPATQNIGPLPDVMRTAIELRLHFGLMMAHGFGQSLPGNGGNGIEFGPGNIDSVFAMAEFDDDGPGPHPTRLYVGGHFARLGGVPASNVACWNGVGWEALGTGIGSTGVPGFNGEVQALAVHDVDGPGPQLPQLYAGGTFNRAGAIATQGIARWNGTSWSSVGGGCIGPSPYVFSLAVLDEDGAGPQPPSLIAGGEFTTVGPTFAPRVARWRNNAWTAMGQGFADRVAVLEVWDADDTGPGLPTVVAGGLFQFTGAGAGAPMRSLARWNGAAWSELGGGTGWTGDQIFALEAVPVANAQQQLLVVGGTFFQFGGVPATTQGLAIWTGAGWFMPASPAQQPLAITSFDDGSRPLLPRQRDVYLSCPSGQFRLDITTWNTTPLPVNATFSQCLMVFDEDGPGVEPPSLMFGGNMFNGPVPSAGIAKMAGMVPMSGGVQSVLATGCGGPYQPTIAATGMPVLGAPFTVQFDCLPQAVPALCVGFPEVVPLPICSGQSSCALGVQPLVIAFGSRSATYSFPNQPYLVGAVLAFQGIEFLALPYGSRCAPPVLPIDLRVSDTLVLTF